MPTSRPTSSSNEKLSKAKIQLIQCQPFFACLAMRLKYTPAKIETCETDGTQIFYNPDYIDRLTVDEIQGVIAHEVMHLALLHHTRRSNRDPRKWNQAADYAINPLLIDNKFALPAGATINAEFRGKSAEEIYNLLPKPDPDPDDLKDNNAPGIGDVTDPPQNANIPEMEANMKKAVASAAMMARRAGDLPEGIERLVEELLQPKINWQEVLARFITDVIRVNYDWTRPNRGYLDMGLILPSRGSKVLGTIILIVDTSGSINEETLNQVGGEAKFIADTYQIDLLIIYVDAQIASVQEVEKDEPMILKPKGGGGTDFRPGFEYIEQNDLQPKAVIYMTDGVCDDFPELPEYPVLWALFGGETFDPPFGEVIFVD